MSPSTTSWTLWLPSCSSAGSLWAVPKNARDKELARAALKREQEKRAARRKKTFIKAVLAVAAVAVVILVVVVALGGNGKDKTKPAASSPTPVDKTKSPAASPKKDKAEPTGPPKMTIDTSKAYTAVMDTSLGIIKIALSPETAPVTVNNFVYLADNHQYDGVLFHRISNDLSIVQGGDVTCKEPNVTCGQGSPGYTFKDELTGKEKYTQGVVAMANAGPNTNGSQFFIVTGPKATQLPPSYTIFGKLADAASLRVAEEIQSQSVTGETPLTPIVINSVKIDVKG